MPLMPLRVAHICFRVLGAEKRCAMSPLYLEACLQRCWSVPAAKLVTERRAELSLIQLAHNDA